MGDSHDLVYGMLFTERFVDNMDNIESVITEDTQVSIVTRHLYSGDFPSMLYYNANNATAALVEYDAAASSMPSGTMRQPVHRSRPGNWWQCGMDHRRRDCDREDDRRRFLGVRAVSLDDRAAKGCRCSRSDVTFHPQHPQLSHRGGNGYAESTVV